MHQAPASDAQWPRPLLLPYLQDCVGLLLAHSSSPELRHRRRPAVVLRAANGLWLHAGKHGLGVQPKLPMPIIPRVRTKEQRWTCMRQVPGITPFVAFSGQSIIEHQRQMPLISNRETSIAGEIRVDEWRRSGARSSERHGIIVSSSLSAMTNAMGECWRRERGASTSSDFDLRRRRAERRGSVVPNQMADTAKNKMSQTTPRPASAVASGRAWFFNLRRRLPVDGSIFVFKPRPPSRQTWPMGLRAICPA